MREVIRPTKLKMSAGISSRPAARHLGIDRAFRRKWHLSHHIEQQGGVDGTAERGGSRRLWESLVMSPGVRKDDAFQDLKYCK